MGSGKSTIASLFDDAHVCSADDYHMQGGKYEWKAENVAFAHLMCQDKCEKLMKMGSDKIVVANTSTTVDEMVPYYTLAAKYGYNVFSIIVENRHGGTNIHNVPEEKIQAMRDRFDIKL